MKNNITDEVKNRVQKSIKALKYDTEEIDCYIAIALDEYFSIGKTLPASTMEIWLISRAVSLANSVAALYTPKRRAYYSNKSKKINDKCWEILEKNFIKTKVEKFPCTDCRYWVPGIECSKKKSYKTCRSHKK